MSKLITEEELQKLKKDIYMSLKQHLDSKLNKIRKNIKDHRDIEQISFL